MKTRHRPYHRDLQAKDVDAVLSSPAYRSIVAACVRAPRSVKQISDAVRSPLASIYRQVNTLCELDVLVVERSAMTQDGKAYDLYRSRIRSAQMRVDEHGTHIEWEPNLPIEDRLLHMWDQLRRTS